MKKNVRPNPGDEAPIIPHASYLVYEDDDGVTERVSRRSHLVDFYTANGDHLETIEHGGALASMKYLLDPNAPLPQPVKCGPSYWPGDPRNPAGYFAVFYDKYGNRIKSYRFDLESRQLIISETPGGKNICPLGKVGTLDLSRISDEEKIATIQALMKLEKERLAAEAEPKEKCSLQ